MSEIISELIVEFVEHYDRPRRLSALAEQIAHRATPARQALLASLPAYDPGEQSLFIEF